MSNRVRSHNELNWNWDAARWKRSTRVWLAVVTIWPVIYIGLFFIAIFSMFLFIPFEEKRSAACGHLDLLQLDRKIKNGEIKQLTVKPLTITARDKANDCVYEITVTNEATRQEIIKEARELVDGKPRVDKVEEETSRPNVGLLPFGFAGLFIAHMATILLMIALLPLYIVLAIKNVGLDQTMRIVWVVLFCTVGLLAMPVYWYLCVWRATPANPGVTAQL